MSPPARTARRIALGLSVVAVLVSIACGIAARRSIRLFLDHPDDPELALAPSVTFLVLLLIALLLRMGAAACELIWLDRTWKNLPVELRTIGPMTKVEPILLVGLSLVPGIAWVWKLGVIDAVSKGFEAIRREVPFAAPVPRRLGMAAIIVGWVPGLNVYVAPFLWEVFATKIDRCITEIAAARGR